MQPELITKLQALFEQDQKTICLFKEKKIDITELIKRQEENTQEFLSMVEAYGFPYKNKVPHDLYKKAVTLALHTSPDNLEKFEASFKDIDSEELIDLEHKAYFIDKVQLSKGEPQIYGTQFDRNEDGTIVFKEILNVENVDELRGELGMQSLEDYKKFAKGK